MKGLKPPVKSRKLPLTQALSGTSLTLCAAEALLNGAEIISEGEVSCEGAGFVYRGSTFAKVDLESCFCLGNEATESSLAMSVSGSVLLRLGLMRTVRIEAERRCTPRLIREMETETAFRVEGGQLFVDIDVECPLAELDEIEGEG